MIKVSFRLIFIALMLFKQKGSIILTEKTVSNKDRMLLIAEAVMQRIRDIAKTDKAVQASGVTIHYDDSKCETYNPRSPDKIVVICVESASDTDNSIGVQFHSPGASSVFFASNIDITDKSSDIQVDPYVSEFFKGLEQQVFDVAKKEALIQEALIKGAEEMNAIDARFINNKIEYTYENKKNIVDYSVDGNMLQLGTDFFKDTIDLNIPLNKFIDFEANKLMKDVIRHEDLMKGFFLSEGETAAQSIKTITCADIMGESAAIPKLLKERLERDKIQVTASEGAITISKHDKSVRVTCEQLSIDDFNLIQLKADFSQISAQISPVTQTFLSKSLYNLMPVARSFFNDLGTFVTRILSDVNIDEDFNIDNNTDIN